MARYPQFAELLRTSPIWRTARARGLCESIMKPLELGPKAELALVEDPKRRFAVALCMALYAYTNPDYFVESELPPFVSREMFNKAMDDIEEIFRKEGLE